jgi:hypothetical protein
MNRKSGYSAEELVKILINPVQEKLCSSVPSSIEDSLCFLIDLNKVPFDNILCDNMGVWVNNGSPKTYIRREQLQIFKNLRQHIFRLDVERKGMKQHLAEKEDVMTKMISYRIILIKYIISKHKFILNESFYYF